MGRRPRPLERDLLELCREADRAGDSALVAGSDYLELVATIA